MATKKRHQAVDPYADYISIATVPSPTPAQPTTGADHAVTIHVPFDETQIQLGAPTDNAITGGSHPGIRMTTAKHVHLTAMDPKTTISLGEAGGELGGDEVEGLSVHSDGEMKEHILKDVTINYDMKIDQHVIGAAEYKYDNTFTEEVKLAALYEYKDTFTTKVAKDAQYIHESTLEVKTKLDRTETVEGNWLATVGKDCKWKIEGELKWDVKGNAEIKGYADSSVWWQGSKYEKTYGATLGMFFGNKNEVTVGLMSDTKVGGILETTIAYKVTLNEAVDCWKGPIEDKHKDLKKEVTKLKSEAGKLAKKEYDLVKKSVKAFMHDVGTICMFK
jgi:hypothetical protein